MGTRGPAPAKAELRILKGNGRDRDQAHKPVARQPMAVPAAPKMPEDLGEHGERVWKLVVPELVRMGILGQVDTVTLEAYCRAYEGWKAMTPGDRGWASYTTAMINMGSKLGLDPASRLRMTLPEAPDRVEDEIFGPATAASG